MERGTGQDRRVQENEGKPNEGRPFVSVLSDWLGETADRISRSLTYSYDISEQDIERHLVATLAKGGGAWGLVDPRLTIQSEDRLRLEANIARSSRTREAIIGCLVLEGRLEYVSAEGVFWVRASRITDLRLGPLRRVLVPLRPVLQWGVRCWMRRHPVFRFDALRPGHVWVHRYLDRIECRPGRLRLQLRRPPNGGRALKP
ncbi:DUF1439 domain-containing protein [Mangrovitalea sediminis]|uniref:DUF1439 domain-containing protein n=1 Tax=Mangrovitalea sediminis TaxID=1982043 RepID=UPI000BE57E91|nr:DUF1439 domain-containing protein [Mangrovitalea sediminis]